MSYSQPLSSQVIIFIRTIGLGVLLGLLYEFFAALRMLLSDKKWAYILCDTAFSLIGSIASFFFMVLFNDGIVRFNLVMAELLGALCFHFSAGKYLIKPLLFISKKLRQLLRFMTLPIRVIIKKVVAAISKSGQKRMIRANKEKKSKKERKKIKNIIKIPLKKIEK